MSRFRFTLMCFMATALWLCALPAQAFLFNRTSVRTTVQRIVEAIERENNEALKDCISPRFLSGNPEIPGRMEDSFEKFEATRINYKIASIREADGIAAVKLNWTKTTTNPMNNWTYRDIGNDVIMYFNAESPYQLVGLENGNLFGVSFLLSTRIVVPAPDEKRLETARKQLEITERQALLAREQAEREAAKAEAKRKEQELIETKRQAREEAREAARQKEKEEAEQKAAEQKAAELKAAEQKAAEEKAAEAEEKKKQETPPMPGSDLTAEELAKLVALESVIKDAIGFTPTHPDKPAATDKGLSKSVRDKAEDEARRMLRATPGAAETAPTRPEAATPDVSPELEKWRQERLSEIRAAQASRAAASPELEPGSPEAIKTLRDIEEAARIQAELKERTNLQAIQMLAEKRAREKQEAEAAAASSEPAAQAEAQAQGPESRVAAHDRDMEAAKIEAQARAKAVLEEIARLQQETPQPEPESDMQQAIRVAREEAQKRAEQEQAELKQVKIPATRPVSEPASVDPQTIRQIEEEARLQAAIKARAEEDAKTLMLARRLDTLTNVSAEVLARAAKDAAAVFVSTDSTPIKPAFAPQTHEELAESIREKAEKDAQSLIKTGPPITAQEPSTPPAPMLPSVLPPAKEAQPATNLPAPAQPAEPQKTAPTNAVAYERQTNAPISFVEPGTALIRGGEQPGGPHHDFKLAIYEVTNDEFADFLNNARANSYNGRGSCMFFDDDGNVYMDASTNLAKRLFAMTDMDFGGAQKGIVLEAGRYKAAPGMGRHPVVGVSWYGALKYCNWLTIQTGLGEDACAYTEGADPEKWHPATLTDEEWHNGFSDLERQAWIDAGVGYRLPMNSYNTTTGRFNEFYCAAAWDGSSNRVFAFGRDALTHQDANFAGAGSPFEGSTAPVGYFDGTDHAGVFPTNPNNNRHGIYDLSGNVWEWSNDTSGNADYRALFGGAFDGNEDTLKNTFRGSLNPYRLCDNVGFRVAITPAPPKRPAAHDRRRAQ